MFRKLTTVFPIALLLGAVSAAPALARTHSHNVVQPHRPVMVSPYAFGSDAYNSFALQPSQSNRRALGETPALPFTQDPESPRG
jgi:hypothetical protein